MRHSTRQLTLSSLFIALGILIPIIFHAVGLGSVFLPMLFPVAISAFFLSPPYAIAAGAVTPLLSALFTGMPTFSPPIAHAMAFECAALAGVCGWLYQKKVLSPFLSLAAGIVASRAVLLFWVLLLVPLLGLPTKVFSLVYVGKGLPGVILIMILVPLLVTHLKGKRVHTK